MRCVVSVLVILLQTNAWAEDLPPQTVDVGVTIQRGLGFLVKDAQAWQT